ncbi:MAG: metalloregulator ArsR/SmtB family transcription factor [Gemmatimonadetes bacterium]|nr:helix-turn-helix transcriptional regulator [Gemmatimonadota bacterium]NIQ56755.1 helix-turn-helix transcriptional regulator [Gemmatimonadota bacterium]NIU76938.1 metalloregulator ArsR/SmtB family transcription factor [Gammaproteobacteria bacterium]NIX46305.1 metalloregulator ArsR/SmtB family transcription factor [Gemmatimonadota bacterium]NIY10632.1 metalloregulator ArsR/SmtB family transcription factor [Gemmatimonadota bacterium]
MDAVFEALADPTRRAILDRLRRDGPLSVTEVAGPLAMTRQGATKHLDVLVAGGLVRVRREGRRRMHELDADPLMGVRDWLAPYAAEWERRLTRLARHLEAVAEGDGRTSDREKP